MRIENTNLFPNKEIAKLIAALYSVSQDCFHIEQLNEYVENNITHSMRKLNKNDYRLIGVFETELQANDYIEVLKKYQKEFSEKVKL